MVPDGIHLLTRSVNVVSIDKINMLFRIASYIMIIINRLKNSDIEYLFILCFMKLKVNYLTIFDHKCINEITNKNIKLFNMWKFYIEIIFADIDSYACQINIKQKSIITKWIIFSCLKSMFFSRKLVSRNYFYTQNVVEKKKSFCWSVSVNILIAFINRFYCVYVVVFVAFLPFFLFEYPTKRKHN